MKMLSLCQTLLLTLSVWSASSFTFTHRSVLLSRISTSERMAVQGAGFGVSNDESTEGAVSVAVSMAADALGDKTATMAFVSATVARDMEEVRKAFVEQLPEGTSIHGITSSGAVLTSSGAVSSSVGCLLLSVEEGDFVTAFDKEDGARAALALKSKVANVPPQAIFMGATPGAEEGVIESLSQVFPGVPVFGGTAADDELSGAWSVMSSDECSGTGVSLVGIGPSVKFGASMLGPYTPTTKTCIATKTDGRRVFEINGKPAADWVLEWLGDEVKEQYEKGGLILPQSAQKPIAVQANAGDELITAHCAAFGGAPEKFVDFFAPVPEGSTLTIMDSGDGPSTGYATALNDAMDSAKSQGSMAGSDPKAGLLVYCGGMAIAVGDNLNAGLTSDGFASQAKSFPMMGMTCFGEQACLVESKKNAQRNLSVGMILFA